MSAQTPDRNAELIDTLERRLATAEALNHELAEKLYAANVAANKPLESYRHLGESAAPESPGGG